MKIVDKIKKSFVGYNEKIFNFEHFFLIVFFISF